jgi:hypothetical protein
MYPPKLRTLEPFIVLTSYQGKRLSACLRHRTLEHGHGRKSGVFLRNADGTAFDLLGDRVASNHRNASLTGRRWHHRIPAVRSRFGRDPIEQDPQALFG